MVNVILNLRVSDNGKTDHVSTIANNFSHYEFCCFLTEIAHKIKRTEGFQDQTSDILTSNYSVKLLCPAAVPCSCIPFPQPENDGAPFNI